MKELAYEYSKIFNIPEQKHEDKNINVEKGFDIFFNNSKPLIPCLSLFTFQQIIFEWNDFIRQFPFSNDQTNINTYIITIFLLLTAEMLKERGAQDYTHFWKVVINTHLLTNPLRNDFIQIFTTSNDYSSLFASILYLKLPTKDKNLFKLYLDDHNKLIEFFTKSGGVIEYISNKYIQFEIINKLNAEGNENNIPSTIPDSLSKKSLSATFTQNSIISVERSAICVNSPLNYRVCNMEGFYSRPSCICKLSYFSIIWSTSEGHLGCTPMVITNNPSNGNHINGKGSYVFKIEPIANTTNFLTCSEDAYVRLWKFEDDLPPIITPVVEYLGHNFPTTDVVCNPTAGSQFASSSFDTTVRLWDASRKFPIRIMAGHYDTVNAISFSNQGSIIATASSDRTSRIFDIRTGDFVRLFVGHSNSIRSVCFYPDGNLLVTSGMDNKLIQWDIRNGQRINSYDTACPTHSISYSHEADCIILITLDGDAVLMDSSMQSVLFTTKETEYDRIHFDWGCMISTNFAEFIGYELTH